MTDTRLAPRTPQQPRGLRAFGDIPPAATTMTAERALELAGVDETELALLASTTFKEAQSLEELVTLIATTRRRGLDGMLRHVYYERFGGANSEPSLHVAIDGLRAIAAATGRYGGRLEPRFSGGVGEVEEGGRKRPAPEKCVVTVYAIVKGQKCAFDGVAWWDEAYPGDGPRGRMWRLRPRSMLALAAERQALRSAFPAETAGIADRDAAEDDDVVLDSSATHAVADRLAMYTRTLGASNDLPTTTAPFMPPPSPRAAELRQAYLQLLEDAFVKGAIDRANWRSWDLPAGADVAKITEMGRALRQVVEGAERLVEVRSTLGQRLADLVQEAAAMDLEYQDCQVALPAPEEHVRRAIETLDDRISDARRQLGRLDDETAQALPLG